MEVRILYLSVTGNTRALAQNLQKEGASLGDVVTLTEVHEQTDLPAQDAPFVVLVPTYLEGGTGVDDSVREVMTNPLLENLLEGGNGAWLRGVIGTGNQNFNAQYVLTAKRYAQQFDVPLLGSVEMRGTNRDVTRLYAEIVKVLQDK